MNTYKVNTEILTAALLGFEQQKKDIDAQIAEIRQMLNSETPASTESTPAAEPTKRKRRKISAAGLAAIAEAQRKRWAASKKAAAPVAPEAAPKPKRKLSAAGKAAIVGALKKRWAAKKAAAAKTAPAAAKKTAAKKVAVKKAAAKKVSSRAVKKAAKAPEQAAPVAS